MAGSMLGGVLKREVLILVLSIECRARHGAYCYSVFVRDWIGSGVIRKVYTPK